MDSEEQYNPRRGFFHNLIFQRKEADQMKKRREKGAGPHCVDWECQEKCVPCIPSICAKFSDTRGKCESCNQKEWVICWHVLRKIPPSLLV